MGEKVPERSSSVIRTEAVGVEALGRAQQWGTCLARTHGALGAMPSTERSERLLFPFICFLSAKNSEPLPHARSHHQAHGAKQPGQNLLKPGAKINLS